MPITNFGQTAKERLQQQAAAVERAKRSRTQAAGIQTSGTTAKQRLQMMAVQAQNSQKPAVQQEAGIANHDGTRTMTAPNGRTHIVNTGTAQRAEHFGGSLQGTRVGTSYTPQTTKLTEQEFGRSPAMEAQYGSYQNYLRGVYAGYDQAVQRHNTVQKDTQRGAEKTQAELKRQLAEIEKRQDERAKNQQETGLTTQQLLDEATEDEHEHNRLTGQLQQLQKQYGLQDGTDKTGAQSEVLSYLDDLSTSLISGGYEQFATGFDMAMSYLEKGATGAAKWALRDLAKSMPAGSVKDKMLYVADNLEAGRYEDYAKQHQSQLQNIMQQATDSHKGIGKWVIEQMPSAGNMLLGAGTSGILGINNLITLGVTAGGTAALEAKQQGADDMQALLYGSVTGLLEAGSERLFGGNPIYDKDAGAVAKLVGKLTDNKTVMKLLNSKLANVAYEGLEEVVTEVTEPWAEAIIYNGSKTQFATVESCANAFLGGVFLSALGNAVELPGQLRAARYEKTVNAAAEAILQQAESIDNEAVRAAAETVRDRLDYGETVELPELGKLLQSMSDAGVAADTAAAQAAVEQQVQPEVQAAPEQQVQQAAQTAPEAEKRTPEAAQNVQEVQQPTPVQQARQALAAAQAALDAAEGTKTEATGGIDRAAEEGTGYSQERAADVNPGGQGAVVAAGTEKQRTSDRIRETVALQNRVNGLRLEKVSAKELGLTNGTGNQVNTIVPEEEYTQVLQQAASTAKQAGFSFRAVLGNIQLNNTNGEVSNLDGFYDPEGKRITVRADKPSIDIEKLERHERFHGLVNMDRTVMEQAAQAIRSRFTEAEFNDLVGQYLENMRGLYDAEDEQQWQLMAEEVLADAYAGMNRFKAGATKYTGAVQQVVDGTAQTQKTANRPTGPPAEQDIHTTARFSAEDKKEGEAIIEQLQQSIWELNNMNPVSYLTGNEFERANGMKLSEQVAEFFDQLGNKVERAGFGTIILNKKSAASDIAHGIGRAKAITFASIPDVIQYGEQIGFEKDWKGRGQDSYVFAAPVDVDGQKEFVATVVLKDDTSHFYLHEVVDENGNMIFIKNNSASETIKNGGYGNTRITVSSEALSKNSIAEENGIGKKNSSTFSPKNKTNAPQTIDAGVSGKAADTRSENSIAEENGNGKTNFDGDILGENENRTNTWLQNLGLKAPSEETTYGSNGSIAFAENGVNSKRIPFEELGKTKRSLSPTPTGKIPVSQTSETLSGTASYKTSILEAEKNSKGSSAALTDLEQKERYSPPAEQRYSINPRFAEEIDGWDGEDGEMFILGATGDVLQGLGAMENDIYMLSDKIDRILKEHPEMTVEEIKRIPEILDDPVLVLKSKGAGTKAENSRLVVFGSIKAKNGQPIMSVLDLMPREGKLLVDDMQKVNSAYTKTGNAANFVRTSEFLFADKNRTIPLLRSIGLTIASRPLLRHGSIGSISYSGNHVKLTGVPFSNVVVETAPNGSNTMEAGILTPRPSAASSDTEESATPASEISVPELVGKINAAEEDDSFAALTDKPDMELTDVTDYVQTRDRGVIVDEGMKNAASFGRLGFNGMQAVYVADADADVNISRESLRHGLDRRTEEQAPVIQHIGEMLSNAVKINEADAKNETADSSYVLLSAANNKEGDRYYAYFIVNKFTNELETVDVMYAAKIKKETAAQSARASGEPLSLSVSKISIRELLDAVNGRFREVMPQSVLRHYGINRPSGGTSDDLRYSPTLTNSEQEDYRDNMPVENSAEYSAKQEERQRAQMRKWLGIQDDREHMDKTRRQIFQADQRQNKRKYAQELLYALEKPDGTEPMLTMKTDMTSLNDVDWQMPNTKQMQAIYQLYARDTPKEIRLSEAEFWYMKQKTAQGSFGQTLQTMSEEAEARAFQAVSRSGFTGTKAMEKLGIKVARSVAKYGNVKQLIENDKAYKSVQKETRKAEKRLQATTTEKDFAMRIAAGVYSYADVPNTVDADTVLELVDYYQAERALGEDRIVEQRGKIKNKLLNVMEVTFEKANEFKVPAALSLNYNTAQRNMTKIFGDELGKRVNELIFDPVNQNEAERIRFINRQLDDVRTFEGKDGKQAKLTKDERALVQEVIEGKAVAEMVAGMEMKGSIQSAAQNIKNGDDAGDAAREWGLSKEQKNLAQKYARWLSTLERMQGDNVDTVRVDNAVEAYKQKFNDFYDAINDFLVVHGYQPIGFIKGYAPHLQAEDTGNKLMNALKNLGLNTDVTTLPTNIAGLTGDYKPNKKWNPYFLHRNSDVTDYDIATAFESYVQYMSDVLYHTDDVMTVRTVSDYFRQRYAPDEIRSEIDRLQELRNMTTNEKLEYLKDAGDVDRFSFLGKEEVENRMEEKLTKLYDNAQNKNKYSNFVMYLDNYANILAGKQSLGDRGSEAILGRKTLNWGNKLVRMFGKAQVAGSISSMLNQTAQLSNIIAEKSVKNVSRAIADMATGKLRRADFAQQSDFLTGKYGINYLVTKPSDMIITGLFSGAEFMDHMVSTLAVRAAYYEAIERGMTGENAMRYADKYGRGVMGDRTKGAKPVAFESKNPIMQMVNVFQIEALNSWEHLAKDTLGTDFRELQRTKGKEKAAAALAGVIVKTLLSAFLLNRLGEELYGGTPAAFDLLGMSANFVASGEGLTTNEWLRQVIDDGWERMFGERLFDTEDIDQTEGGFGWEDAIENLGYTISNDIPFLRNTAGLLGLGDETLPMPNAYEAGTEIADAVKNHGWFSGETGEALLALGTQFAPAGRQISKTAKGIMATARGGVYSGYGDDEKLRYPVDNEDPFGALRAALFGVSAMPETEQYYARGASPLSKDKTQDWKDIQKEGLDSFEAYDLIQTVREIENNDELTNTEKGVQKRAAINELQLTDYQKWSVYEKVVESKAEDLATLLDTGMNWQSITDAYDQYQTLYNTDGQTATQKATALARYLDGTKLTNEQKAAAKDAFTFFNQVPAEAGRYESLTGAGLDSGTAAMLTESFAELEPEKGSASVTSAQKLQAINSAKLSEKEKVAAAKTLMEDTTAEKLQKVVDDGLKLADYLSMSDISAVDRYIKYAEAGVSAKSAKKIGMALAKLEEENGTDETMSENEKYRTIFNANVSANDTEKAIRATMNEDTANKVDSVSRYGISCADYADYKLSFAAVYGSDNVSQEKAENVIDQMGLSTQQAAAMWQMANKSWKAKNNPYSATVGQAVYDVLNE